MRQVVAYKRLKTIENHETFTPNKGWRALTRGGRLLEVSTVRLLLRKVWCFGSVVAYGRRLHMEVRLHRKMTRKPRSHVRILMY